MFFAKRLFEFQKENRELKKKIDDLKHKEYDKYSYMYDNILFFSKTGNGAYNLDVLDYFIGVLKRYIQYFSSLEITKHKYHDADNVVNPFEFNFRLEDYVCLYKYIDDCGCDREQIEIDFSKTPCTTRFREKDRIQDSIKDIKKQGFIYGKDNHKAMYYDYLDVACIGNGFHHAGVAATNGVGKMQAEVYHTGEIFENIWVDWCGYIQIDNMKKIDNEKYWYNHKLFHKPLETNWHPVMILLYRLCRAKYRIEKEIGK